MSIILNIDTSIETASVSIAREGNILISVKNAVQKDHAGFLHVAIKELLANSLIDLKQLDAIAVTKGPGSYTGLRVGMATAKGLAYALNKPLICIGTLDMLAQAAIQLPGQDTSSKTLFCPMIDARRMEVYTAVFEADMKEVLPACAMILNEHSFGEFLKDNDVLFVGSGAAKWSKLVKAANAGFLNDIDATNALAYLSYNKFKESDFSNLSYSEPLYVKDFFSA